MAIRPVQTPFRPMATGQLAEGLVLALVILAVGAGFYLLAPTAQITSATNLMITLVAVFSLSLFSGNSGILSFATPGFMAIGAQISATLTITPSLKTRLLPDMPEAILGLQLNFWIALAIAVAVAMIVAALLGLALSRLPPMAFSLSTLGVMIIVHSLFVASAGITRGNQAMHSVPKLTTLASATGLAAAMALAVYLYRGSLTGLALRASRENEAAARSIGINVERQRLTAWVLGAGGAALAGALLAHHLTVFTPKTFYLDLSFSLIVMMVFGGMSSVSGAALGTICVFVITETARRFENGFSFAGVDVPQLFGLTTVVLSCLILLTLYRFPRGLLGAREIGGLLPFARLPKPVQLDVTKAARSLLSLRDVGKNYGGVQALQGVNLDIQTGEIVGLIGPNGSGKSTLLACIAGTNQPTSGQITLDRAMLNSRPTHEIARMGLARTFQTVRLFNELTVLANIVAALGPTGGELPESVALALLAELSVADLALKRAGDLAYGQSRRVEIARALALQPRFLLLDEPAAGMNEVETSDLLATLRRLCDQRGLGLIIVDHDMHLIMSLCPRIVVLNKGQLIADGTPEDIRVHPEVREAYLGRARGAKVADNTHDIRAAKAINIGE